MLRRNWSACLKEELTLRQTSTMMIHSLVLGIVPTMARSFREILKIHLTLHFWLWALWIRITWLNSPSPRTRTTTLSIHNLTPLSLNNWLPSRTLISQETLQLHHITKISLLLWDPAAGVDWGLMAVWCRTHSINSNFLRDSRLCNLH